MKAMIPLAVAACSMTVLHAQVVVRGSYRVLGHGCNRSDNVLYEVFDPGAFDLDGTGSPGGEYSIVWARNANGGYAVSAGGSMLPFGSGTDTSPGIQPVVGPFSLGFPFDYPGGGSTTSVDLAPAGYVYMDPAATTIGRCCDGLSALTDFFNAPSPSFAVLGSSLNVGAFGAGTIWFDTSSVGGRQVAYFTWDGVVEGTDLSTSNTCQIQFWDDHTCVMSWNGVSASGRHTLVGWSGGFGQPDFGPDDLSSLPIDDGGDGSIVIPPTFAVSPVGPLFPFTFTMAVHGRPGTVSRVLLLGLTPIAVDLDVLGLPNCTLYSSGDLAAFAQSGPFFFLDALLPSSAIGAVIQAQGVALNPGANSLGLEFTNGAELVIGASDMAVPSVFVGVGMDDFGRVRWVLIHDKPTGPNITAFTINLDAATTGDAMNQRFDTDDPLTPFQGGNSSLGGCLNSYDGTDATTGLAYPGTMVSNCDPLANTGWVASIPYLPHLPQFFAGDYRKLRFEFADFQFDEQFRFRCTHRGGNPTGAGMDGAIVTIEFADGSSVTGEMVTFSGSTGAEQQFL